MKLGKPCRTGSTTGTPEWKCSWSVLLGVRRQLWLWEGLAVLIFVKCHLRSCPGLGSPAQDMLLLSLKGVSAAVDSSRGKFFFR